MERMVAVCALAGVAVLGTSIGAASAEPTTDTRGYQTVASKYQDEDEPGHEGVSNAASRGRGEGPCGFGNPPGHTR